MMTRYLIALRRRIAGWLATACDVVDVPPVAQPRRLVGSGIIEPTHGMAPALSVGMIVEVLSWDVVRVGETTTLRLGDLSVSMAGAQAEMIGAALLDAVPLDAEVRS
jgi:hypothetical protein